MGEKEGEFLFLSLMMTKIAMGLVFSEGGAQKEEKEVEVGE